MFARIALDTSDYDSGVKDVTKSGESLASKLKSGLASAGKVAAAGIGAITIAAGAAVGGLLTLEGATEEYRIAQGKLKTAFDAAGMSADAAQEAYSGFYAILGDTDTATEASQLLAKLAESEEDVSTWTNIAAGVFGTFGDSLPIEGLIEASNETAKVGQVTGVLADALNWAGISEDDFNTKLAACSDESKRNQLVMETLSGTYDDAADAFYRNNEAIVTSRENQQKLNDALSKIGEAVTNVKNAFIEQFAPVIEQVSGQVADFVNNLDVESIATSVGNFINFVVQNGPTIISIIAGIGAGFLAWKVSNVVTMLVTSLGALRPALTGATTAQKGLNVAMSANPIGAVITIVSALVTAIITLWNTNEGFRNAVTTAWNAVKNTISGVVDTIKTFFTQTIPKAVGTAIEWFKSIPQKMVEIGKNIVSGIWDGIQNMASWIKDKITGFFSGIVDGVKDFLGIHSPSTVFSDMGKNMALGLGEGWDSEYDRIRRDIEGGMNFGTANVDFASSGIGMASVGMVNGIASALSTDYGTGSPLTVNLVLPDGSKFATWQLPYLIQAGRAAGTPIANPQVG